MFDLTVVELRDDDTHALIGSKIAPRQAPAFLRLQIARNLKQQHQVKSCYAVEKLIDQKSGETSTLDKYDMYYN